MSQWKQPPVTESLSEIDRKMIGLMERYQIVGLSVAAVKDDRLVWSNAYGWADLDRGVPVTEETVFRIASISKLFTATALMQQVEQGKCQLDDDIGDYLGFAVRNPHHPADKITFRQLLTHTTSLHEDEQGGELYVVFSQASRNPNPPSLQDLLVPGGSLYRDTLWSSFAPGDPRCFAYSNLASMIVAALVEKLSGTVFDEYVRHHILRPLGMDSSDFNVQALADIEKLAVLYGYEDGAFMAGVDELKGVKPEPIDWSNYAIGTNGSLYGPQGGLRTNAVDLSKFVRAMLHGGSFNGARILKEETVEQMLSTQWKQAGVNDSFDEIGLQFHITDQCIAGKRMYGHGGNAYGLLSGLYFDRDEKTGLVFITSGSNSGEQVHGGFYEVEAAVLQQLYEAVFKK